MAVKNSTFRCPRGARVVVVCDRRAAVAGAGPGRLDAARAQWTVTDGHVQCTICRLYSATRLRFRPAYAAVWQCGTRRPIFLWRNYGK